MTKYRSILVPHTHWDREWYLPFQQFRIKLVEVIDGLLDIMESDPDFAHFTLDGQMILLEDYLEVRDENKDRLLQAITSGKIAVGPWYCLPDEFLVSGESLVRNLIWGRKVAMKLEVPPMPVGYLPDMFGHISQMPQILRRAGLDTAIIWRGVGDNIQKSEFLWRAPDGSQVLGIYLPDGYGNAVELPLETASLRIRLQDIIDRAAKWATTPWLLLMNGSDHRSPQEGLPHAIKKALESIEDFSVEFGTVNSYVERVREEIPWEELVQHVGELRSPSRAHLLPGVLSAHIYLKQRNSVLENLYYYYVEPLSVWAAFLGEEYPTAFIEKGLTFLLQNHPHDSICGCSVDSVHEEMMTRFANAEQIGETIVKKALETIEQNIDTSHVSKGIPILIFNPVSWVRKQEIVEIDFEHPTPQILKVRDSIGQESPIQILESSEQVLFMDRMSGSEFKDLISQFSGRELMGLYINDIKIQKKDPSKIKVLAIVGERLEGDIDLNHIRDEFLDLIGKYPESQFIVEARKVTKTTALIQAKEMPSVGISILELIEGNSEGEDGSPLQIELQKIENEFYRVEILEDGILTITDKELGVVLPRCNYLIDEGDAGDEYNYSPPLNDLKLKVKAHNVEIKERGPLRATLKVLYQVSIPKRLTENRETRSSNFVNLEVLSFISVCKGVRRVDFHTHVFNNAEDHRLRVLFNFPEPFNYTEADGHFHVVKREITVPPHSETSQWPERPIGTVPQREFISFYSPKKNLGMTLINKGLPEVEVIDLGEQGVDVALTLLRSVGWLSRDDFTSRRGHAGPFLETTGSQMIGSYRYDYSIITHKGNWQKGESWKGATNFNIPCQAILGDSHGGSLTNGSSLVSLEPDRVVISSIVMNEDNSVLIRLFNKSDREVKAKMILGFPFRICEIVNIFGEKIEDFNGSTKSWERGTIDFQLTPWEIRTFRVTNLS